VICKYAFFLSLLNGIHALYQPFHHNSLSNTVNVTSIPFEKERAVVKATLEEGTVVVNGLELFLSGASRGLSGSYLVPK